MRICLSLQISRLFFCNAMRRSYEFQKQTGRNANPSFTVHNGSSFDAVTATALRIISISFAFAATTILCGYFASGLGNGIINMVSSAIRQFVLLIPCLILLLKTVGIRYAWYAFWIAEIITCVYSYCSSRKLLKKSLQ